MSDTTPREDPALDPAPAGADVVADRDPLQHADEPTGVPDKPEPDTLVVDPPEPATEVMEKKDSTSAPLLNDDPPVTSIPIIRDGPAAPPSPPPSTSPPGETPIAVPEKEPVASNAADHHTGDETVPPPTAPKNVVEERSAATQAWKRLATMGAPRLTRANVAVTSLAVVLGFALSTQISHTQTQGLESLRPSELVGILDTVTQRSQRLGAELQELERVRDALTSGQSGTEAAVRDAQQQVDTLGILNGNVQAVGPGVSISVKDPAHKLTSALLLDLVQELRDAGAEAIQMGNQRVVASTYFADQPGGGMMVNGVAVSLPLTVIAIGDSHTLKSALSIPGGVVETARQQGGSVEAQTLERVHVTAVRNLPTPSHARPATSPP